MLRICKVKPTNELGLAKWRRVRLGKHATKGKARIDMVLLRWADAVFVKDNHVFIVEAKLRPDAGALSQLILYESLFKKTPEFKQFWDLPIEKIFLCPVYDTHIKDLVTLQGITYEVWKPKWWKR